MEEYRDLEEEQHPARGAGTRGRRHRLVLAPVAGAASILGAWLLLEWVAWISVRHAGGAGAAAGRFAGLLFVTGIYAGVFGGMVTGVVSGARPRWTAILLGALGAVLLAAGSWLAFRVIGVPGIGESAASWAAPLVLCAGLGAWIGSLLTGDR